MTSERSHRSTLHLQMGQETIYLLLTIAVFAALVLAAQVAKTNRNHEDPPIITLSESQGYFFSPGSATLSAKFSKQLANTIAPTVKTIANKYDARVVEVIGHTDEVPLGSRLNGGSDLDRSLIPWLAGTKKRAPIAADNAGLGMARAVTVARALRESGLGSGYVIVPMSAGAFLRPDDSVTDGSTQRSDERRRRIEIRVRRAASTMPLKAPASP